MATNGGDPANVERLERNDILHRKNVALLLPEELAAFRQALEEIKEISKTVRSDRRGFFEHAGQHGVPYWRCPHHTPNRLFLPWHRASLYRLEQALQDRVPGVTLPWWDWPTTRRIPEPFDVEEVDGQPNTLFKSETLATAADRREGRPVIEETFRLGEDFTDLPTTDEVEAVLQTTTFIDFSDALEGLHDSVHVVVNGTMGDFAYAAFDPVFWVHHCMVDRIWWLWQRDNRINAVPTRDWEDIVLEPYNMTVRDTLIANALGYEYADTETALEPERLEDPVRVITRPVDAGTVIRSADFSRADLEIGGIRTVGTSYEGRVYVNNPDATIDTGKNDTYVGSFHVFAHGGCFGAEGHCDAPNERRLFDVRPLDPAIRMKKRVTVTEALRGMVGAEEKLQLTIVAIPVRGSSGDAEPEGLLDIKRMSVVTYR